VLVGLEIQSARLWGNMIGQEVHPFAGYTHVVCASDGQTVLNSGNTGAACSRDLTYLTTLGALCGRLLGDVTTDERAQYGSTVNNMTCPKQ